jgi:hypothetical protein
LVANERGEQILGRILESYLSLPAPAPAPAHRKTGSGGFVQVDSSIFPNLFICPFRHHRRMRA